MNLEEVFNFYKGKKILVTGHTGFKGTWLSRILVNAGAEVTGYSLNPPTDPALFNMAPLVSASRILIRRGISATRVFIPWKKEKHIIPQMQV